MQTNDWCSNDLENELHHFDKAVQNTFFFRLFVINGCRNHHNHVYNTLKCIVFSC